jgi:hypothetical protein
LDLIWLASTPGTVDVSLPGEPKLTLSSQPISAGCSIVDASVDGIAVGTYITFSGMNADAERLGMGLFTAKLKLQLPDAFADADAAMRLVPLTRLPTFVAVRMADHPPLPKSLVTADAKLATEGRWTANPDVVTPDRFETVLACILFEDVFSRPAGRRRRV